MANPVFDPTNPILEKDTQNVGDVIFESMFTIPEGGSQGLARLHAIYTGILCDQRITLLGNRLAGQERTANCDFPTGEAMAFSAKKWSTGSIGHQDLICSEDFQCSLQFLVNNNLNLIERFNLEGSPLAQVVTDKGLGELIEAVLRVTAFGDTGAVPTGPVVDASYLTAINGYWKQIDDAITAGDIPATRVIAISENGAGTLAGQLNLADSTAYDTMKAMYLSADPRLKSDPTAYFALTDAMFDNYAFYLAEKQTSHSIDYLLDGSRIIKNSFFGIDVIARPDWSRNISTFYFDGTVEDKPNRALLTTPSALSVGLTSTASLDNYEFFYDRANAKNIYRWGLNLDVKLLEENYKIVVAY